MKNSEDSQDIVTVSELLKNEQQEELASRDGQWNAFTSAVFRQLDQEDLSVERQELPEQAISMLKNEVNLELQEMMPRFEEAFKEGIESRIWEAAKEKPSFWTKVKAWWQELPATANWGLGLSGAVAAAAMVVAVGLPQNPQLSQQSVDGPAVAPTLASTVSVEDLSFEGSAMVVPHDGVTLVILSDA